MPSTFSILDGLGEVVEGGQRPSGPPQRHYLAHVDVLSSLRGRAAQRRGSAGMTSRSCSPPQRPAVRGVSTAGAEISAAGPHAPTDRRSPARPVLSLSYSPTYWFLPGSTGRRSARRARSLHTTCTCITNATPATTAHSRQSASGNCAWRPTNLTLTSWLLSAVKITTAITNRVPAPRAAHVQAEGRCRLGRAPPCPSPFLLLLAGIAPFVLVVALEPVLIHAGETRIRHLVPSSVHGHSHHASLFLVDLPTSCSQHDLIVACSGDWFVAHWGWSQDGSGVLPGQDRHEVPDSGLFAATRPG